MKKLYGLTIILILAVMLTVTGCASKDEYDLTGSWNLTATYTGYTATSPKAVDTYSSTYTFTGSETSGTVSESLWGGTGSYTVTDSTFTFNVNWSNGNSSTFTGSFSDESNISGSFQETWGWNGTFVALKMEI